MPARPLFDIVIDYVIENLLQWADSGDYPLRDVVMSEYERRRRGLANKFAKGVTTPGVGPIYNTIEWTDLRWTRACLRRVR